MNFYIQRVNYKKIIDMNEPILFLKGKMMPGNEV